MSLFFNNLGLHISDAFSIPFINSAPCYGQFVYLTSYKFCIEHEIFDFLGMVPIKYGNSEINAPVLWDLVFYLFKVIV